MLTHVLKSPGATTRLSRLVCTLFTKFARALCSAAVGLRSAFLLSRAYKNIMLTILRWLINGPTHIGQGRVIRSGSLGREELFSKNDIEWMTGNKVLLKRRSHSVRHAHADIAISSTTSHCNEFSLSFKNRNRLKNRFIFVYNLGDLTRSVKV